MSLNFVYLKENTHCYYLHSKKKLPFIVEPFEGAIKKIEAPKRGSVDLLF